MHTYSDTVLVTARGDIMSGIYMIQNLLDGKIYIGQAEDIGLRWSYHINQLKAGKHPSKYLQEAVNAVGIDNFCFRVICECPKEQLNTMEQYYIFCLETTDPRAGYNRQWGGSSNRPCESTKKLMAESHRGKKHSEETKRKISETMKKRHAEKKRNI